MLTRRTLVGGAALAGVAMFTSATQAQTAAPLSAVIVLDGRTYVVTETDGEDMGDFVSPIGGFTQRCVRAVVPALALTVFFRPDRGSDRAEVVFELGRLFQATPTTLPAYTVEIRRGDQPLATIAVPAHYWFSRWRWQSAPRPVVGNVAALISQGLLPPYDRVGGVYVDNFVTTCSTKSGFLGSPGRTICTTANNPIFVASQTLPAVMQTVTPYTVMGLAGIEPYMPRTGERADIGLVTECQAQYICTGAAAPLSQLRAQAEAAGTVPWHMRDENSGAPIDFRLYPNASWYWDSRAGDPWIRTGSSPVTPDTAHQPSLAYLPYMLTGDPYHLEDMQFAANFDWGSAPYRYRPSIGQSRGFAWHMRTLAQCARVTPAATPRWLLPQAYWTGFLNQNRLYLESAYVNSPSPVRAYFRSTADIGGARDEGAAAPSGTWIDPWQDEFLAAVMGWIVAMGFKEWQSAFDWKIGTTIARTSPDSGWVRAHATPYRVILRESASSPLVQSWQDAWALTARLQRLTYTNPDVWAPGDRTYLTYTRGALAFASALGSPGADAGLAWATRQLTAAGWRTAYKWRLGTGL